MRSVFPIKSWLPGRQSTSDEFSGVHVVGSHPASREEREVSGVNPFVELRYRRRGRSISRIVNIRVQPQAEGIAEAFEVFFGVG
jgi:hypothetical protein